VAGEIEFGWSDAFLERGLAELRLRARASRVDAQGRLLTGTLRWSLGSVDVTLGREAVWLGPGREGSLLLSNEAPPFDQVRISPTRPGTLPWWFRALGTTSYQISIGRLAEKRRDFGNPLLWSARFSAAPTGWLELGATRTVLFGGDGRTGRLKASDLVEILLGLNENLLHERDPSDSDQIAAVDATVALPFVSAIPGFEGARIGLEYAGEDNLGPGLLPTAVGHTAGGEIVTRVCDVRLEVAETVDDGILWYRHRIFSDGYRYRGRFLGHAMGGDSRQGVLEIVAPTGASAALGACYEERRHGGTFGPERTEIRRTVGFRVSGGAGTWSLRYRWRSTFGPLSDEEARGERRAIEIIYEPVIGPL
jgi:hypothetical protein